MCEWWSRRESGVRERREEREDRGGEGRADREETHPPSPCREWIVAFSVGFQGGVIVCGVGIARITERTEFSGWFVRQTSTTRFSGTGRATGRTMGEEGR